MTSEELAAIRQRCERATPGPWRFRRIMGREYETLSVTRVDGEELDEPTPVLEDRVLSYYDVQWNWVFIAHARTDIPALLAEVERLTQRVEELSKMHDEKKNAIESLAACVFDAAGGGGV